MNELHWQEHEQAMHCRWHSENGAPPPKKVMLADERMNADVAYKLVCEGTALLWRGDFHQAKNMLQALGRRITKKKSRSETSSDPKLAFHKHRQAQAQRARILGMLLIPFEADYRIPLRRAPDVRTACNAAYGAPTTAFVASLRELLGLIGAHEWHKNGVEITALNAKIYPSYGVFSPLRGEYLDLLAQAPLPSKALAFDIGTGTGVIAALLAQRGVAKIIATELDARAIACAQDNLQRLGFAKQVQVLATDLFPEGQAPLIVCNPPWLPATPHAAIEHALYDPESRMLRAFLAGAAAHLTPDGEAWLIMSDFAEHLHLRSAEQLQQWVAEGGLSVIAKHDIRPRHTKANDASDPLFAARSQEVTSLWRLRRTN